MIRIDDEEITFIDNNNQMIKFLSNGNGDYYFILYSNYEARSGDYYSFVIDDKSPFFNNIKFFVEKEVQYWKDPKVRKSSYFIIENNNSVMIADQNSTRMAAEWVKFLVLPEQIKIIFSEKFPASVRVVGVGRQDHYPFSIPVVNLFNAIQKSFGNVEKTESKSKTL